MPRRVNPPRCTDCRRPFDRFGLCDDCKELRDLISTILGDKGHRDPRDTEADQTARRVALHRSRAKGFRHLSDPRFYR